MLSHIVKYLTKEGHGCKYVRFIDERHFWTTSVGFPPSGIVKGELEQLLRSLAGDHHGIARHPISQNLALTA